MVGLKKGAETKEYTASFDDDDLSSGILTVTHNLGKRYNNVTVTDNSSEEVTPEITATSTTVTTIDLSAWGTITGTWNVTITAGAS